jgi:hypothetical protein
MFTRHAPTSRNRIINRFLRVAWRAGYTGYTNMKQKKIKKEAPAVDVAVQAAPPQASQL